MAASSEASRDHGISDALGDNKYMGMERGTDNQKDSKERNGIHNDRDEDNNSDDELENRNAAGEKQKRGKEGSVTELDLRDPDNVIHLLETVDLNDEDTDVLLQEAYHMNKKLKEMLRRQEVDEANDKPKGKPRKKSSAKEGGQSNGASRQGSAFSVKKPLPPISQEREVSNVYAIKLRRSQTQITDLRHTRQEPKVNRSKSSKPGPSQNGGSSNSRKTKQTDVTQRPDWNNRFNYT